MGRDERPLRVVYRDAPDHRRRDCAGADLVRLWRASNGVRRPARSTVSLGRSERRRGARSLLAAKEYVQPRCAADTAGTENRSGRLILPTRIDAPQPIPGRGWPVTFVL